MLEGLFPEDVATAWGDPFDPAQPLFPEEEALVAGALDKRKREFAKGRECARTALASFGHAGVVLLSGERREPLWPADVVGSITHSGRLCAVAVARSERYAGLGIDAEPVKPLGPDVARRVFDDEEAEAFARLPEGPRAVAPLLVFSAKESVYKCLFPITRAFLAFDAVSVTLEDGAFRARLRKDSPPFRAHDELRGRWRRSGDYVVTAAWVERTG